MNDRLPNETAALFREPPEGFVVARDALVVRLRGERRDEEAAAVRSLRRPTAVVWALNQLSARDPAGVEELVSAGAELRAAQQATLSSAKAGADRLRSATAARRAAVARLAGVASDVLEEAGRGARPEEVASALEAASVEEETGGQLAAGTLERMPDPVSGFGDVFGLTAITGGAQGEDPPRERSSQRTSDDDRAEAEAEVARLRRDRDAAVRRARKAREVADRLVSRVEGMRERLAAAEAVHTEADANARDAELEAAGAERDLAAAAERLDALSS